LRSSDTPASEEAVGHEEPDDAVDVWGNQEESEWTNHPNSDEEMSEEAQRKTRAVVLP
jgi:hypothetical protein